MLKNTHRSLTSNRRNDKLGTVHLVGNMKIRNIADFVGMSSLTRMLIPDFILKKSYRIVAPAPNVTAII